MPSACVSDTCGQGERVELTGRELEVCSVVCGSSQPISFTQVRETTRLHQEIVSRVIRRLRIHGLVRKVGEKYEGNCACCCE